MSVTRLVLSLLILSAVASLPAAADDVQPNRAWHVVKATGEVWIVERGAAAVALSPSQTLSGGQGLRTGANGRALLSRGEESILVSPNSSIDLPPEQPQKKLETTILQSAGEILLTIERKSTPHLEVQTPFLAALVKGTVFRVSVAHDHSSVNVVQGRVDVASLATGEHALVLPGQSGTVSPSNGGRLHLEGSGAFEPIQAGTPRVPMVSGVAGAQQAHTLELRDVVNGLAIGGLLGAFAGLIFAAYRFLVH